MNVQHTPSYRRDYRKTIIGTLFVLAYLFPVYWMVATSLKSLGDIFAVPPRLIRDPKPRRDDPDAYHVAFTSTVNEARMEVFIDRRPAWSNIVTGLEFDRRTRWGELYKAGTSEVRSVAKHDWLRTPYTFAHAVEKVAQLLSARDVASEDDHAAWLRFSDERACFGVELRTRKSYE